MDKWQSWRIHEAYESHECGKIEQTQQMKIGNELL